MHKSINIIIYTYFIISIFAWAWVSAACGNALVFELSLAGMIWLGMRVNQIAVFAGISGIPIKQLSDVYDMVILRKIIAIYILVGAVSLFAGIYGVSQMENRELNHIRYNALLCYNYAR